MAHPNPPRHGEGGRRPEAGGGGGSETLRKPTTYTARKLRKEMSLPEVLLWQRLRAAQAGVKIRRQHPIGPYVADFYCSNARIVIEVDGEVHDRGDRPASDAERDKYLKDNGYDVVRVLASDVLRDPDSVAASIAALVADPLHQPAAGPPPHAGEDLRG